VEARPGGGDVSPGGGEARWRRRESWWRCQLVVKLLLTNTAALCDDDVRLSVSCKIFKIILQVIAPGGKWGLIVSTPIHLLFLVEWKFLNFNIS